MFRSIIPRRLLRLKSEKQKQGFSLVELVVVILIVSILAVAVFTGGSLAISRAKKARVANDFHTFGVAFETVLNANPEAADIAVLSNKEKLEGVMALLNNELSSDYKMESVIGTISSGGIRKLSVTPSDTNYLVCESKKIDPWQNPYYIIIDRQNRVNMDRTAELYITVVTAGPNSVLNLDGAINQDDMFLLCSYVMGNVTSSSFDASEAAPTVADGSAAATNYVVPISAPVVNGITIDKFDYLAVVNNPEPDPGAPASPTSYLISTSIMNGTYTGAASIGQGDSAFVTITPNSGYRLPDSVTVSGATSIYNTSTVSVKPSGVT